MFFCSLLKVFFAYTIIYNKKERDMKHHYGIVEDKIPGRTQHDVPMIRLKIKDSKDVVMFGEEASDCLKWAKKGSFILFYSCRINQIYNNIVANWFAILSETQFKKVQRRHIEKI
jgi:hypothetical protein